MLPIVAQLLCIVAIRGDLFSVMVMVDEAGTIAAALTVRVERTPFSASEQAPPTFEAPVSGQEQGHGGEL